MGLDMYLSRHVYVGANYEHNEVVGDINIKSCGVEIPIKLNKVTYIVEESMYWRKANHIHKWFVDNVQDGNDDMKEYFVGRNKLQELLTICKLIKEDNTRAEELLPTSSGFFFGTTEIDGYYFKCIFDTCEQLERELSDPRGDFYYSSSW
jgi:hypothetical protein